MLIITNQNYNIGKRSMALLVMLSSDIKDIHVNHNKPRIPIYV